MPDNASNTSGGTGMAAALTDAVREHAGTAVTIGVIMIIAGTLALLAPALAGLSIAILVGLSLAVSGISQCFFAFKAGVSGRGLALFAVGTLMAFAGFYMVSQPLEGLLSLTLLLVAYLLATGLLELVVAFQMRPAPGWGLQLANGLISVLLGILLWQQFPLSGIWAVGVLFGIKMIFSGWALVFIGRAAKKGIDPAVAAGTRS